MSRGTFEEIAYLIESGYSVEDALRKVNGQMEIGSPGYEVGTININGAEYKAGLRINDFNNEHEAEFIIHRHSSTLPPAIVGARAKSNNATHTATATGDVVLGLYGAGWAANHYGLNASIEFKVGAGTVSDTSHPGKVTISTCVDGAVTLTNAMEVDNSTTATHTRFLVYDVDNGQMERVTVGAADSGGAGFKVLRIPN